MTDNEIRSKTRGHRRVILLVSMAATVVVAAALASSVLGDTPPERSPIGPDVSAVIQAERVGDTTVSLVRAANEDSFVCLVVDMASGARLSGCGDEAAVAQDGAALSASDPDGADRRQVWGLAPQSADRVSLGSESASVSSQGFYSVSGASAAVFRIYSGTEVLQESTFVVGEVR